MIPFELTWWDLVVFFLILCAVGGGPGFVLGFLGTYVPLSISARRGGRAPKGRPARICLALLAGLVAGTLTFSLLLLGV